MSRKVALQCVEDARQADDARARLRGCQRELDVSAGQVAELDRQILQLREEVRGVEEQLRQRPRWITVVTAAGAGAAVALCSFGLIAEDRRAVVACAVTASATGGLLLWRW